MPKDDWASTRRRDAVRRAKADKPYFSRRKSKGKGSKAAKRDKIKQQMQASKRQHDKALGPSKSLVLRIGQAVQISRDDGAEYPLWQPYNMRKTLTLRPAAVVDGFAVFKFEGWLIRIPRPSGF